MDETTDEKKLSSIERQALLRRLKHGPKLSREELAAYALRLAEGLKTNGPDS